MRVINLGLNTYKMLKINCMEILYKFFKTWFDHYKKCNSNQLSTYQAITAIILELGLLGINISFIYKYLIIGKEHVFKEKMENYFATLLMLVAYYFIARIILKKIIVKYFLFDEEKGESSKYFYESTKKIRNLNVVVFWGLFALPVILLYIIRQLQN